MSNYKPQGKTTLSPEVLVTITKMSALSVPGVSRLAAVPPRFERLFKRGSSGVELKVEDELVYLDIFLALKPDVNVREVSRNVQQQVARAIEEMIGMDIGHVNIHIEDIDYPEA
ncbi:MAG: Asp23/Gls24 family envelope stress response protein [Anaerolineales bacterium]|jgi:uncharacterized alkaline shock family protein YloU|nr:Asp23/Gls24 family envelope stress response protein [Anaerolineales bacterium]